MRSTGIVRRLDSLGRVVLPMEMRRSRDIAARDPVEIYVDGDKIVLAKYQPACVFCGDADGVERFMGKNVCHRCLLAAGDHLAGTHATQVSPGDELA